MFDCSKYNKREGQGCDLNNLCRYPNCLQHTNHMKVVDNVSSVYDGFERT